MKDLFDPEDGTLMIPECLGTIDSIKEKVNFESTSSNLGRSLRLYRQNNRVGLKNLIVIQLNNWEPKNKENRDPNIKPEDEEKVLVRPGKRTYQESYDSV